MLVMALSGGLLVSLYTPSTLAHVEEASRRAVRGRRHEKGKNRRRRIAIGGWAHAWKIFRAACRLDME